MAERRAEGSCVSGWASVLEPDCNILQLNHPIINQTLETFERGSPRSDKLNLACHDWCFRRYFTPTTTRTHAHPSLALDRT